MFKKSNNQIAFKYYSDNYKSGNITIQMFKIHQIKFKYYY